MRQELELQQWKSTKDTIAWFEGRENKSETFFFRCDIVNYYSEISEELFEEALELTNEIVEISDKDRVVFRNSHKAFLCSGGENWRKKNRSVFDTTFGSTDGAEICE